MFVTTVCETKLFYTLQLMDKHVETFCICPHLFLYSNQDLFRHLESPMYGWLLYPTTVTSLSILSLVLNRLML